MDQAEIPALIARAVTRSSPTQCLIYLAQKIEQPIPSDPQGRLPRLQWLIFQMGSTAALLIQYDHLAGYAPEKIAYAFERCRKEVWHLQRTSDNRLQRAKFLANPEPARDQPGALLGH